MKVYQTNSNLRTILFFFIFFSMISDSKSQSKYFQIQIGGQIMQNYNLDEVITKGFGYGGGYIESRQSVATTFNQDISFSSTFDKHHGIVLGGGLYTTCRLIDVFVNDDTPGGDYFYDAKPCYKNYSIYLLYQYTYLLSPTWNIHASVGPMWAKNYNWLDWFFVPVKLNYFSGIGKLGVQYMINDHFSLDLNGMAVRSLTNIVDENQGTTGSIIPFLVGLDFRVGYQF